MRRLLYTTPRLEVHSVADGDEEAFLAVYGDADAMRWVDDGRPITPDECAQWVRVTRANYIERGYGMSRLELTGSPDGAQLVGFCGLVHPNDQAEVEVKYALLRQHWGRGLATEALGGMLKYGERAFEIREVIATSAPENRASHRVLEKNGFVPLEIRIGEVGDRTQVHRWRTPRRAPEDGA